MSAKSNPSTVYRLDFTRMSDHTLSIKDFSSPLKTDPPVTSTRTGDEFYAGNNGEANQSKYPMELRARLTRQNSQ